MGLVGLGDAVRSNIASMWSDRLAMSSITEQANSRRQQMMVRGVERQTTAEGIQKQGLGMRGSHLDIMA